MLEAASRVKNRKRHCTMNVGLANHTIYKGEVRSNQNTIIMSMRVEGVEAVCEGKYYLQVIEKVYC